MKKDKTTAVCTAPSRANASMTERANQRFNHELDNFKRGTHKGLLHLGEPSICMIAAGIVVEELTMSPNVLNRKLKQHKLTTEDLKGLVKALKKPILIYKHKGSHSYVAVVVTDKSIGNTRLSAAFRLDFQGNVLSIDNVASIHQKIAAQELERLNRMKDDIEFKWIEKEKVQKWGFVSLNRDRQSDNSEPFSITKIMEKFENPKCPSKFPTKINGIRLTVRQKETLLSGNAIYLPCKTEPDKIIRIKMRDNGELKLTPTASFCN